MKKSSLTIIIAAAVTASSCSAAYQGVASAQDGDGRAITMKRAETLAGMRSALRQDDCEADITTASQLKPKAYVAQREKEGCKHRPDVEVYGRVFSVYDRTDSDANIILSVATPFEDGMFIMTLKAGPQRLPMEETHAAMYDNMKTLLERIVFR